MSDDDDEDSVNVIIDYSQRVTMIRYLGNTMAPVRLKIRAEVFPSNTAMEIDFDITFARIRFWFETIVARSIVFCRSNKVAMDMLLNDMGKPKVVNHLMVTPFEPTDEHLAVLFQSKMGALAKGTMDFGNVRVEADNGGLVFTYVGEWQNDLPTMENWFDVKPYYFNEPWWQREDASTLDVIAENADVSQLPPWAYKLDFIDAAIRPEIVEKVTENVVIRGAFRPKIIPGGGDDE